MWLSATNSPDGCVYVWEKLFTVNRNLLHTKYGVEEKTKVTPVSSPVRYSHARAVVMRVSFLVLSKPQADPSTGNRRYVAGYLLTQTH